jgi:hypothetical protein
LTSFEWFVSNVIFCLLSNNILHSAPEFCLIECNVMFLNQQCMTYTVWYLIWFISSL